MSAIKFQFDFSREQHPELGLTAAQVARIRRELAIALRVCGYKVRELHGMIEWNHNGCHCTKDVYDEKDHKLYITLSLDWPSTPPAAATPFILIALPQYIPNTQAHGIHVNMEVIGKPEL